MKKSVTILLAIWCLLALPARAYDSLTVMYQTNYQMDCYIPSQFTGCPNPNDRDTNFYACGPSNVTILILMHGGFFEYGSRVSMTPLARTFAAMENMIVLNIDYRKGWGYNPLNPCGGSNAALQVANYRVVQDAHAAINYFITHASDPQFDIANADRYTWNVFAGGYSAGGVTALNMHATQAEWDTDYPWISLQEGQITRTPGSFKYLGCFAIGGGAANMAYLKEGTYNVLFHGENDPIMPYTYGYPVNQACSTYTPVNGGFNIFQHIQSTGIANCKLYSNPGGHGAFASSLADAQFVANKFVSDISSACYWTSCGMIPGPPFWAGKNCPELIPGNFDVPFMPLPPGVRERAYLDYFCPLPPRLHAPSTAAVPANLPDYMNLAGTKMLRIFDTDGRLLYQGQALAYTQVTELINQRFANQLVIVEVSAEGTETRRFRYFGVE